LSGFRADNHQAESAEGFELRRLKRLEARGIAIVRRHDFAGAFDLECDSIIGARSGQPVFIDDADGDKRQVVAVGLLLGAAPGLVAFTLVLAACRRTSRRFRILWGISSSLLGSSLAVAVVIAAYPFMGDIMRGLVSVLIPALAVVASLAWSGVVSLHQGPDRRVRVA